MTPMQIKHLTRIAKRVKEMRFEIDEISYLLKDIALEEDQLREQRALTDIYEVKEDE